MFEVLALVGQGYCSETSKETQSALKTFLTASEANMGVLIYATKHTNHQQTS